MLPKTAVVSVRKTLERGYTGTFTVTERQKVARDDHSTGFAEVQTVTDQPCRLSFTTSPAAGDGDTAALTQSVKLFCAPEVTILEGSRVTVTQNGVTGEYARSGMAAMYDTHAEYALEAFRGWA